MSLDRSNSSVLQYIAISAGSVGSITGQGCQQLATAATFLRSCVAQAINRGDEPPIRYTLRRNIASTTKISFEEGVYTIPYLHV